MKKFRSARKLSAFYVGVAALGSLMLWSSPASADFGFLKCFKRFFKIETVSSEVEPKPGSVDLNSPRYVGGNPKLPITFGLEIEASIRENPKIVLDYRPTHIDEAAWLKIPEEERVRTARDWEDQYIKVSKVPLFERLSTADPGFPQTLKSEGDGNVEFKGYVFNTVGELKDYTDKFVARYGRASMQAHVAYPATPMPGTTGYIIFEADASQFQSFERNYSRYEEDKSITPAKNLVHHSLGPLGEDDKETFAAFEQKAARGEKLPNPWGSRITSAPVFRGDVYPEGVVGHELRQFHKRNNELVDSANLLSWQLASPEGLARYHPFTQVRLIQGALPAERTKELGLEIDTDQWRQYFLGISELIRSPFPNLMYGGAHLSERFFFPLRDWERYPLVENLAEPERTAVRERIRTATRNYIKSVDEIVHSNQKDWDSIRKLQVLNAKWGDEVKLSGEFEKFRPQIESVAPPVRAPPFVATESVFPNGKPYVSYKMDANQAKGPEFEDFLSNSAEVIYTPTGEWGHIRLRVGKRIYGFENLRWTKAEKYHATQGMRGKASAVFYIPKKKIEEVQSYLEKFYKNGANNNLPPFDGYSPLLELKPLGKDNYTYVSPSETLGNNAFVNAQLVESGSKLVLKTPDGFEYPVIKMGGKKYVQSLSCSTSATCVLQDVFGLSMNQHHGAKDLIQALMNGNPGYATPDAIIEYGP